MTCEICPIINDPDSDELASHLIEGLYWRAALRSRDQSLIGTSFITAKRHVESLSQLSNDEQLEFFEIEGNLERAIKQAFGAQVVNVSCLMNLAFNQTGGNPTSPHVHWHLKPRYAEAVMFEGMTFQDPSFGSYLDEHHLRQPVDTEMTRKIVTHIQSNIQ